MRGSSEITRKLKGDKTGVFYSVVCGFTRSPCFREQRQQELRSQLLLSNSGQEFHFHTVPPGPLAAHIPRFGLCSTPFSALLWYHSTGSALLFPLDWPSFFRLVWIVKLQPIVHHRFNTSFYPLNENSYPLLTAIALSESPMYLPFSCYCTVLLCSDMVAFRNISRTVSVTSFVGSLCIQLNST